MTYPQISLSVTSAIFCWLITKFGLDTKGEDIGYISQHRNVREFLDMFKSHQTQEAATIHMPGMKERIDAII